MTDTDPTPERPRRPASGPVQYKGADLDAERGPGLGCFRFQLILLAVLIVLTPATVLWRWPPAISAILLFAVIILLLVSGQTIIFLLRLVAADRRGRRRPLASGTKTVGELEDERRADPGPDQEGRDEPGQESDEPGSTTGEPGSTTGEPGSTPDEGPVRQ